MKKFRFQKPQNSVVNFIKSWFLNFLIFLLAIKQNQQSKTINMLQIPRRIRCVIKIIADDTCVDFYQINNIHEPTARQLCTRTTHFAVRSCVHAERFLSNCCAARMYVQSNTCFITKLYQSICNLWSKPDQSPNLQKPTKKNGFRQVVMWIFPPVLCLL